MPDPTHPRTIGDDLAAKKAADAQAAADAEAATQATAKAKTSAALATGATATLAADLGETGDIVQDNGDGTFTAYYRTKASDGTPTYTTDTLRGVDTPVPAGAPASPPAEPTAPEAAHAEGEAPAA